MANERRTISVEVAGAYLDKHDFDGEVCEIIKTLQELEERHPGCFISVERDWEDDVVFRVMTRRPETDREMYGRIIRERRFNEFKKKAELLKLEELKQKYEGEG